MPDEETFYRKVDGEFVPVSYYCEEKLSSFPLGFTLVHVTEDFKARLFNIDPDRAGFIAVIEELKNDIDFTMELKEKSVLDTIIRHAFKRIVMP